MSQVPSTSSDLLWVEYIMTQTKSIRVRLYIYLSQEDYEEGLATESKLVTGHQEFADTIYKWFATYSGRGDAFILDMVENPRF